MISLSKNKRIHFIGIGGGGMSAIARILLEMEYKVSGSDLKESISTIRLKDFGATIYYGHTEANLRLADVVVVSTAISHDNPEYAFAVAEKLPILHRAQMLGLLMDEFSHRISVCGTHGKTTTSSMITRILEFGGKKPTFLIGADLNDYGSNAMLGGLDYFVAESDESDGSFLHLSPSIGVFNNLEPEHMDYYKTWENVIAHFHKFMAGVVDRGGYMVINADEPALVDIATQFDRSKSRYFGIQTDASVRAVDLQFSPEGAHYTLMIDGKSAGEVYLKVHGVHNIYNALAATVVALNEGISVDTIKKSLFNFTGTKRRFQLIGEVNSISVYDDYGHHPTEIRVTLDGARRSLNRRIVCIFQPHRYTRTRDLLEVFPTSFEAAGLVVITEVYSANEQKIRGVSGRLIVDKMKANGFDNVMFVANKSMVASKLIPLLRPDDVVITMGAGDISSVGKEIVAQLKSSPKELRPVGDADSHTA